MVPKLSLDVEVTMQEGAGCVMPSGGAGACTTDLTARAGPGDIVRTVVGGITTLLTLLRESGLTARGRVATDVVTPNGAGAAIMLAPMEIRIAIFHHGGLAPHWHQ